MPRTKPKPATTNRHHAEVLDLAEAAYLRIAAPDVLRMVREQGLSGRQVAGEWRFLKAAVQDWLRNGPGPPRPRSPARPRRGLER